MSKEERLWKVRWLGMFTGKPVPAWQWLPPLMKDETTCGNYKGQKDELALMKAACRKRL